MIPRGGDVDGAQARLSASNNKTSVQIVMQSRYQVMKDVVAVARDEDGSLAVEYAPHPQP